MCQKLKEAPPWGTLYVQVVCGQPPSSAGAGQGRWRRCGCRVGQVSDVETQRTSVAGPTTVCGVQLEALAVVQPQCPQELVDCSRVVLGPHHQHIPYPVPAEGGGGVGSLSQTRVHAVPGGTDLMLEPSRLSEISRTSWKCSAAVTRSLATSLAWKGAQGPGTAADESPHEHDHIMRDCVRVH